jgi:hypothetical protein
VAEPTSVWKILTIGLIVIALLEAFRAQGAVTRPTAFLVLALAALQGIFIFGLVGTPGTIGLTGWIAIISTAILMLSAELVRLSGGVRTAGFSLLLFIISLLQLLLTIGLIRL